ncbi:PREDICTED: serpin B10-like [Vollenhovia emeryi]|uniref:serpin B10-like n=1 Tax=Vollenhovia emeryi TaxID=411798 RepID=UPI0005F400CA|nr:PREDICTED: serpin B10-like [Vollenhovia emeryi]XP_011872600.1 PREDICTED: serpin B10-like [Vollenhovia emeryi]
MLSDERFKFALESLKKCTLMEPKQNIFFSPHLIYHDLLMVYFGASDDIENSLRTVLYIPDGISKAILQQHYVCMEGERFCYAMKGILDSYKCRIYNKLWLRNSECLKPETSNLFLHDHETMANSDFESSPDIARLQINCDIAIKTKGTITCMLTPDIIDSNTNIVLTSMIYLSASLLIVSSSEYFTLNAVDGSSNYNEKLECDKEPSTSSGKNTMDEREFAYKILNEELVKLGLQSDVYFSNIYLGYKISMLFISTKSLAPKPEVNVESAEIEQDKIINLIQLLTTEEASRYLRLVLEKGLPYQSTIFTSFHFEEYLPIYKLLEMLNVPGFMSSGPINLPGFGDDVTFGNAVHQVRIEMTNSNFEAAASNAFFNGNSSTHVQTTDIPEDIDVPSICLIYDKANRNILFCGILWSRKDCPVSMV